MCYNLSKSFISFIKDLSDKIQLAVVNNKLIVGYFPGRVIHGQDYRVSDIPADKLTHVIGGIGGE